MKRPRANDNMWSEMFVWILVKSRYDEMRGALLALIILLPDGQCKRVEGNPCQNVAAQGN
jgi:hypothetical protein